MTVHEYRSHLQYVSDAVRQHCGYEDPRQVGLLLGEHLDDPSLTPVVERVLYTHETKPYLYPYARQTIETLLQNGDYVCVWSDDFIRRPASAGLGEIRKQLPNEERKRLFLKCGKDKFSLIPSLVNFAHEKAIQDIVFIDDKASNLHQANDVLAESALSAPKAHYILTLQASGSIADCESLNETLPGTIIHDIGELIAFRRILAQDTYPPSILWVSDFNHTLVDTQALEAGRLEQAAVTLFESKTMR